MILALLLGNRLLINKLLPKSNYFVLNTKIMYIKEKQLN